MKIEKHSTRMKKLKAKIYFSINIKVKVIHPSLEEKSLQSVLNLAQQELELETKVRQLNGHQSVLV